MELRRIRALRGPNRWSRHTALEILVACDEKERSLEAFPGLEQRLRERFPDLPEPSAAEGGDDVTMADVLEITLLALQAGAVLTGARGFFGREIARELNISLHTVKAHVRGIMGKLALRSRVEIAAYAFQDRARSRLVTLGLALVPGISATDMAAELLIGFQALFGLSLGSILA